MRFSAIILVLLGFLLAGCGGPQGPAGPPKDPPEGYGYLPGLRTSPNQRLRDELARITEEAGTPELLSQTRVADSESAVTGLLGLFPERKAHAILEDSEKVLPSGNLPLSPDRVQKAIDFRTKYEAQRQAARTALLRPGSDLGIRFTDGYLADLGPIEVVRLCGRLEKCQAAESLAAHRLDEAIEALSFMLRAATCLGGQRHGQARAEAAFLRTEAFVVLQAIVSDRGLTHEHLDRLHDLVRLQMDAWPSDAEATLGERALGMHAYEMVRDGRVLALLTPAEIERFQREGVLEGLAAATVRTVDQDELYYLATMRKIIEACKQPYYRRVELFDAIDTDLEQMRDSPEFPVVAARVLLPGMRKLHVIQAQDRANWEAWSLALALATGRPAPYEVNPLTGAKYQQEPGETLVVIEGFGSGEEGDRPRIAVARGSSRQ